MKNKDKIESIAVTACFLLFLYVFFAINILSPSQELSTSERRRLAQFPEFSIESVFNGKFIKAFDDYSVDQIVFRNEWRSLKTQFDLKAFWKFDVNGNFIVDDMIFKLEYPLNEGSVKRLCGIINYCDQRFLAGKNVCFTLVPDKNYYLESGNHLILDYDQMAKQIRGNLRENIKYIDLFGALSLDCYYMTDSHWKQEKLSGAVSALAAGLGVDMSFDTAKYKSKSFSPFYGVYYGQSALNVRPDEIVYFSNAAIENAVVTSLEKPGKTFPVYDESQLGGMDSYSMFMLGPAAIVNMVDPSNPSGRALVIFRDSYASSLAPLLLDGYGRVTLVDLRYIRPDLLGDPSIVGDYLDFEGADILFMFSSTIFNSSDSIKSPPAEAFMSPFHAKTRMG